MAIEDTKDSMDAVEISELHDDFKEWYEDQFNNTNCISKRDFKKNLSKRFKKSKIKDNKLIGFKFREKFKKNQLSNYHSNKFNNLPLFEGELV